MLESNTGLQTRRSSSSAMPMRLLLKSATKEESMSCSDGKCSRLKRTPMEKRLPLSRTLTLLKLLRSHSGTLTSTQHPSHTLNLLRLELPTALVWLMSTHTLSNTEDSKTFLLSEIALRERPQEPKMQLTLNAQL